MEERVREIRNRDLPLKDKLLLVANEMKDHYHTDIYFCKIIGKRWSYVTGSGDIVNGIYRIKLTDYWGIISDIDFNQIENINLTINLIKNMLID